uniref:H.polymorpha DL1 DNA for region containing 9 open reading frames n=1 Tax=Pichia angusta TaxID=870730 RepID=Q04333_PICAN|nr:unnamed protein product [Ogataea angusta]
MRVSVFDFYRGRTRGGRSRDIESRDRREREAKVGGRWWGESVLGKLVGAPRFSPYGYFPGYLFP